MTAWNAPSGAGPWTDPPATGLQDGPPGTAPRIMVIGASGFLGRHVAAAATAAGLDVITAGRSAAPGAQLRLDLSSEPPAQIAAVLAEQAPDVVVNCAGATRGDIATLADANITATAALVTALRQTGRSIRLVHLGSAAEYGPSPPGEAVAESAPARPASPYGAAKLAGTRLVELGRLTGLDAVVLRVFNPVGPGAPDSILPGRVAAQLRQAAADGGGLRLGPLDAVRDFVDARDVADAVLAAALAPSLPAAVINVGSGTGTPVRKMVAELVSISGYDGSVTEGDNEAHQASSGGQSGREGRAPGGPSWQQADISLAARDLRWQPRRDLPAALAALWEDHHAA